MSKIEDLTSAATVPLLNAGGQLLGTGFFVADETVMTAAHVVEASSGSPIFVGDRGALFATRVANLLPRHRAPGLDLYPLPDLAVLSLTQPRAIAHIVPVELGKATDPVLVRAFGFSDGMDKGAGWSLDVALLEFEGFRMEQGVSLLKLKDAEVAVGMSGGPLLDLTNGTVIGILKASRGDRAARGCYAVSATEIEGRVSGVWAANTIHHRRDATWRAARSGVSLQDPVAAAWRIADVVLDLVERRSSPLPQGLSREALHQVPWCKRWSTATVDKRSDPAEAGERFRWDINRTLPMLTIVSGRPGIGKSWLLAQEAARVAAALRSTRTIIDVEQSRIPLLLDCSTLASRNVTDADMGLQWPAAALAAMAPQLVESEDWAIDSELFTRAYNEGKVQVFLDGLDELPPSLLTQFRRRLAQIMTRGNHATVTTRPGALGLLQDIGAGDREDLELLEFGAAQVQDFVAAWFASDPPARSQLSRRLAANASWSLLASTPLLLSFMCRVFEGLASLPEAASTLELCELVAIEILSGRPRGESSTAPVLLDSAPNPRLRLKVLSDAMGTLQDSWRGYEINTPRDILIRRLREHPDYPTLHATAAARLRGLFGGESSGQHETLDPVLWEYIYDGFLTLGASGQSGPELRPLHPLLADYLLASYFAHLQPLERLKCLERHRWFDPNWQRVIVASTPRLGDIGELVSTLMSGADVWCLQASLAAELVTGAGANAGEHDLALIDRLVERLASPVLFERKRSLEVLSALVRSETPGALAWARREVPLEAAPASALMSDVHQELALDLVSGNGESSLRTARQLISVSNLQPSIRSRLVTELAAIGTSESLAFADEIVSDSQSLADLRGFLSGIRRGGKVAVAQALTLVRRQNLRLDVVGMVSAAVLDQGEDAPKRLLEYADDWMLRWGQRARIASELLRAGHLDATRVAIDLSNNPNVSAIDRAVLVVALLQASVEEAVPIAANLLVDASVPWTFRRSIARGLAHMGAPGVRLLVAQLQHAGVPLDLKTRHLDALIEVGSDIAVESAIRIHAELGAPVWVRVVCVDLLSRRHKGLLSEKALLDLLDRFEAFDADWRLVAQVLLGLGGESARQLAEKILGEVAAGTAQLMVEPLRRAGSEGIRVLNTLVKDSSVDIGDRCEALFNVVDAIPGAALRGLVDVVLADAPSLWRARILLGLGRNGHAPRYEEFVREATRHRGGYRVLYEYILRADVHEDEIEGLLEAGRTAYSYATSSVLEPEGKNVAIKLDNALLQEWGIEFDSDAEAERQLRWLRARIEEEVGLSIARTMVPEQLDEFEAFIDAKDEKGGQEWLLAEVPEYHQLAGECIAKLRRKIESGALVAPRQQRREMAPLELLRDLGRELAAVVAAGDARDWTRWHERVASLGEWFSSPAAKGLLRLSVSLDRSWPRHEASLYASELASSVGLAEMRRLVEDLGGLLDHVRGLVDVGDYEGASAASALACYRYSDEAACWFYASLALAGMGSLDSAARTMRRSGSLASASQREAGLNTLAEVRERLNLDQDGFQSLAEALAAGNSGDDAS